MKTVTKKAYAKINLYLDVLNKRDDGYHNILSVMHAVGIYDTVTVKKAHGFGMTCSDPSLSVGDDNLCLKAARAFFDAAKTDGGCFIELEKRLPREAGLGGGSADAAAVLRALNDLYDEVFSENELCTIGARIGADVPFCVTGGSALAEGIGEILSPFPLLPPCHIVVCEGREKISTPTAYKKLDSTSPLKAGDIAQLKCAMEKKDLSAIGKALYNRFEDIYPDCSLLKSVMTESGAEGALMSGSGSAVYGIFSKKTDAERAYDKLVSSSIKAFLI